LTPRTVSDLTDDQLVTGYTDAGLTVKLYADEIARRDSAAGLTAATGPRGAAATGHVARMTERQGRAQGSPERRGGGTAGARRAIITAAASAPGVSPGQVLTSRTELAELTSETLRNIAADPEHYGRKHKVATSTWSYPPERQLGDSAVENTAKIEAVCGPGSPRYDAGTGALVATGGVCLPTNVDYSVPTWSTADRPLRDGLPAFQATRGGVQFMSPPDLGVPTLQGAAAGAGLATTVWTEATDAAPGGATKPVWQVACGTPQQVYVNAVPTRVQFGNMQSRFAPEMVAANTEQAIATAAREAELELLTLMYGPSKQVLPRQYLGATRDLLASADLLAQQYRYSHRIGDDAPLTAVFPAWAKGVLRADLARELAHDTMGRDPLAVTDAQIGAWFGARGINALWTLDGLRAGTYGTGGQALPNQFFALATAGAEPQWPNQAADGAFVVGWLLYVEGSFQFLDGGRLDLGVVRDSVLDATNDYETFVEPFEAVAFRGVEVYQVLSTVLPTGGSAGSIASTSYHE
jgi:hypothetical protein